MPIIRPPSNYPRGINLYVPVMQGTTQFDDAGFGMIDFGTPNAAVTDAILDGAAVGATYGPANTAFNGSVTTAAAGFTRADGQLTDCPYGRIITAVASGAGTNAVTINGFDYLGQPLQKVVALNGNTPISFLCAFKYLTSVTIASGGAITVDMGFGNLGVPFKLSQVTNEWLDGVRVAPGTLTAPVLTDPATNATGDPRGTYAPTSTMTGAARLQIQALVNNSVGSLGNGGLHGIRHFGG